MKLQFSVLAVLAFAKAGFCQFTCLKGDCKSGYGEAVFSSGAKYYGEFQGGRAHGLGTMYFSEGHRYSGHWNNQYREGRGRFTFASGDEYLGDFLQNQMEGKGVMTYANGNIYQGDWKAGHPHGKGELKMVSGSIYTGYFVEGKFEGLGTMQYPDGSRFVGQWKNGKRSENGTFYEPTGKARDIANPQNEIAPQAPPVTAAKPSAAAVLRNCNVEHCGNGVGKYSYRNGNIFVGEFRNGLPEGEGKVAFSSGDIYIGGWFNHQPQGKGTMFYKSGEVVVADWVAGHPKERLFEQFFPCGANAFFDSELFAAPKVHAVVVGIAQYQHIQPLRYADDDAYRMYTFLRSPEGGSTPSSQIQLLIDEEASNQSMLKALNTAADAAGEEDALIFYFSGHGEQGAFLPVDHSPLKSGLAHEEIRSIFERSKAKYKIVIADACHAGSAYAMRSSVQETMVKYYSGLIKSSGGFALMLSSKGEELSMENSNLRSGVFSHFLIEGLEGVADINADRIITVKELYTYLYEKVRSYTGGFQSPLLLGNFDPNMPFGIVR